MAERNPALRIRFRTPEQRAGAMAEAKRRGVTLSEFVRQALDREVGETCPTCGGTGKVRAGEMAEVEALRAQVAALEVERDELLDKVGEYISSQGGM
jgi:hypothetical protein